MRQYCERLRFPWALDLKRITQFEIAPIRLDDVTIGRVSLALQTRRPDPEKNSAGN